MKNKKIPIIIFIIVIIVLSVIGVKFFYDYTLNQKIQSVINTNYIYEGITIDNVDVSLLTKEQAEEKLKKIYIDELSNKTIILNHNLDSWTLSYKDIDVKYDIKKAIDEAWNIAREGKPKDRYNKVLDLKENGENISLDLTYSDDKLINFIEKLDKEVSQEPIDSVLTRKNGTFIITNEQVGYVLDTSNTLLQIKSLIESGETGNVTLTVQETLPSITKEQNEKVTNLLGSYSTNYTGSDSEGRNINLKVACNKINGTILSPNEVFSMNETLGDQTYENGYREGGVIVNGKIESGIGGGVCQVTTTLYNAVIFSELDIVERKNHSLAVGYVPLGRDAAIAGTWKDFKFKNSNEYPIYIEAFAANNKVVVNIYGYETRAKSRKVDFERVYLNTIEKPAEKITEDPTKPEGFREVTFTGKTGSKVSTYKLVYENDKLISREWFSDSTYSATADEVTIGTGPAQTHLESNTNKDEVPVFNNSQQNNGTQQNNSNSEQNNIDDITNNNNLENNETNHNSDLNSQNTNDTSQADENYIPMGA